MRKLFYDFETYYDNREFTLRKMTPVEYILDPRFEALGCAFAWEKEDAFWVEKPDLPAFFNSVDWSSTFAVSHNALFDACILKWVYDVNPALLGDTLAMSRAWLSYLLKSVSLAALSQHFGFPPKMLTLHYTSGVTYDMLLQNPQLHGDLKVYGCDDTYKCREVFWKLLEDGFPVAQLEIIDMQIRMATEARFVLNRTVLAEHYAQILNDKATLLQKVGLTDDKALQSNDQLALLLMAHGCGDPPMKWSKTQGKEIWAFAKSDEEFTRLLQHPEPMVQNLVAARLGHKSTLEETRTERFIAISNLQWNNGELPGTIPIALKYSGAHTHRFSGDWKLNAQNLGRTSRLREALEAPIGHKVVSGDASQIEARLNALGAGQNDLVEQFRTGVDPYCQFASMIFSRPITKTDVAERFIGKTSILSLGYGSGWPTFQNMVRVQSAHLPGGAIILANGMAEHTVSLYRAMMSEIVAMWRAMDQMIHFMASAAVTEWRTYKDVPVHFGYQCIALPNGHFINYRDLHQEVTEDGKTKWFYYAGPYKKVLYGAKVVENYIQALAFIHIMDAAMRIKRLTKGMLPLSHQVHDELIYIVPDEVAVPFTQVLSQEIARPPTWWPNAPLAASAGMGTSYATVK